MSSLEKKISKDFMPLLTGNNKKARAVPQDMISLFELNLLSAFCSSVLSASLPRLSRKAESLAVLFLCYIFIA